MTPNVSTTNTIPQSLPTPRPPRRLRRMKRAVRDDLPPFQLTARDRHIIHAVHIYRALTTVQLEQLFWGSPTPVAGDSAPRRINPRCQLRLKLLYHHGYLHREEQLTRLSEGSKPLVYFLDARGADLLEEQTGEEIDFDLDFANVTSPFLQHLLVTNDVRIAIICAASDAGATLTTWIDDKALKSPHQKDYVTVKGPIGKPRQVAVVPDGYFVLDINGRTYHHFLEIDRGTETVSYTTDGKRDWGHKIRSYLAYFHSGKYQARYHTQGLRILTVTTGERRMQHLKEATEAAGGKSRFWFTTFSQLTPRTVLTAPIWQVATKTTPHRLID